MGTLCQVMTFPTLPTVWVPPLNYNTPATVLVICPLEVYTLNQLGFGQETRKETRHVYVLVWRYKDTNLIMWSCSYICTTRRESLGHERVFFFGIYCLSQRRNREHGGWHAHSLPCDQDLHATGSRGTRVWTIGTRGWVHRVVDPARREGSLGYIEKSPHRQLLLRNFVGRLFLARSICTTNFSHPILVRRKRDLSRVSV